MPHSCLGDALCCPGVNINKIEGQLRDVACAPAGARRPSMHAMHPPLSPSHRLECQSLLLLVVLPLVAPSRLHQHQHLRHYLRQPPRKKHFPTAICFITNPRVVFSTGIILGVVRRVSDQVLSCLLHPISFILACPSRLLKRRACSPASFSSSSSYRRFFCSQAKPVF